MTRARAARLAGAIASGLALALARPPADLGPLALVALVPLFVAWRGRPARGRAGLAFVGGVVYFGTLVSWAWYFGPIAVVPLVAVLAASWALVGAGVGLADRLGIRSPWSTAALWVVGEAIVARFPLRGLSWGEVGYALHDVPVARAVASVGGVPAVSFLVVALNALVADAVVARRAPAAGRAARRAGAGAALVGLVVVAALVLRVETEPAGELRVAVLQGNDRNRDLTRAEREARYLPNSHFGLAARVRDPVDLIVFPESSLDEDPRTDDELGARVARTAVEHDAWVLVNATADGPDPRTEASNLNVLYDPDGEVAGTYAKRHLVPYGEYVPFGAVLRPLIPVLDEEIPRDHVPGGRAGLFDLDGVRVATVICFESVFGHEVRPLVRDGAEVIVVSTNNRSYRRSANSAQHLAIGQMRAAETGRPLVQAAISGISAFVDADGDVHATTDLFERTTLEATVTPHTGETLYVRFGEWVLWGSVAGLVAAAAARLIGRRGRSVESGGTDEVPAPAAAGAPPGDPR
ncbi:MAG: apolipoprotein N-acyltransferase [Acidimicrobiia bacterium]|nr:MAG: apolipoprotein N-acyltransferase [Acidimicrobiia bacterium]